MIELALDLGAKLGYCIRFEDGRYSSGMKDMSKRKGDTKYTKLLVFENFLETYHKKFTIKQIYYERVDFGTNTYATQAHGALKGVLNKFAESHNIPIKGFAVSTIKKKLTGKGNASKMGMIYYAEKYIGKKITDDNEGDAIGVMYAGRNGKK